MCIITFFVSSGRCGIGVEGCSILTKTQYNLQHSDRFYFGFIRLSFITHLLMQAVERRSKEKPTKTNIKPCNIASGGTRNTLTGFISVLFGFR